jgi:hypothetical protein
MRKIIYLVNTGENMQASYCFIIEIKLTSFICLVTAKIKFRKIAIFEGVIFKIIICLMTVV